jgi:hypothetical protein
MQTGQMASAIFPEARPFRLYEPTLSVVVRSWRPGFDAELQRGPDRVLWSVRLALAFPL